MKVITGWLLFLIGFILVMLGLAKAFLLLRHHVDVMQTVTSAPFFHGWLIVLTGGAIGMFGLILLGEYAAEDYN
jgi:hypothetical protein